MKQKLLLQSSKGLEKLLLKNVFYITGFVLGKNVVNKH